MLLRQVEDQIGALLLDLKDRFPESEIEKIREMLEAGEPGVAFENLCVQLFEFDVVISRGMANKLIDIAASMRLKTPVWVLEVASS